MTQIATAPFLELPSGHRILTTIGCGLIAQGTDKDGSIQYADYHAGSLVLVDAAGDYLCGPIDFRAAGQLALAVCASDRQALTSPQLAIVLATALVALSHIYEPVEQAQEAVH